MIPLTSIKRVFKQHSQNHISQEAVIRVKDFLEEILNHFAREIEKEFHRYNEIRRLQGLRKKKRIPAWIVCKVSTKFLNAVANLNRGSQSLGVVSLGGEINETRISPPKPAGGKNEH